MYTYAYCKGVILVYCYCLPHSWNFISSPSLTRFLTFFTSIQSRFPGMVKCFRSILIQLKRPHGLSPAKIHINKITFLMHNTNTTFLINFMSFVCQWQQSPPDSFLSQKRILHNSVERFAQYYLANLMKINEKGLLLHVGVPSF